MKLPDTETLLIELIPSRITGKSITDRQELISLIEEYFGEHDAYLIFAIALYFKRPEKYSWLYPKIKEALEEV